MTVVAEDRAIELAGKVLDAWQSGKVAQAITLAKSGVRKYPEFRLPSEDGNRPSFGDVVAMLEQAQAKAPAVSGQESAPKKAVPARKAAPARKAPAARKSAPAPVKADPTVLTLVHDGAEPTSIFGIEKASPGVAIIGRAGQKWRYFPERDCFYLPRTRGYAADMERISAAITALESARDEHDNQVYRVETKIEATGADGEPLRGEAEVRAERLAWQQAYTTAQNLAHADLGISRGTCALCGATGLSLKTGQISKGGDGLPRTECVSCEQTAARPTIDLSGLFKAVAALPAAPAEPEVADCPKCHEQVRVSGGKLMLHSFNGAACRGKLGVVVQDVEPEPAAQPARKSAPAVKASAVKDSPAKSAEGLVVRYQANKMSGTALRVLATAVRSALTHHAELVGVSTETHRDNKASVLTIQVKAGGGNWSAAALAKKITEIVKAVEVRGAQGVRHQIHKAA